MTLKKSSELVEGGIITEAGNSALFKTGDWREQRPEWTRENCIHCLFCWIYCPDMSITLTKAENGRYRMAGVLYDYCKGCGICAFHCTGKKGVKALVMKREEK